MAGQPFNWGFYYTLANELATRADEAAHRSAISRAYYYVYHLALIRATTNGFRPIRGEATHAQLWRKYSDSPDPACRQLGEMAKRLKEKRERADYNQFYPRLHDDIDGLINDAQDFATRLGALPQRFPQC